MILNLNDKYRINSDSVQWITQKLTKGKKGDKWSNLGYYSNFESALTSLSEYRIRKINSDVPDKILKAVKEIREDALKLSLEFSTGRG